MNKPTKSKINLTQIIMLWLALGGIWGFIDEELKNKVYETALIVGPILTIIFRTWFTKPAWWKKLEAEIERNSSDVYDYHDYN